MHKNTLLLLPVLLLLNACARSPMDQALQGIWEWRSDHLAEITAEQHLHINYTFDRGAFVFSACCFLQDTTYWGHYYITEEDENRATIMLTNIEGLPGGGTSYDIQINYDPETDTFVVGNTGPFIRITPKE